MQPESMQEQGLGNLPETPAPLVGRGAGHGGGFGAGPAGARSSEGEVETPRRKRVAPEPAGAFEARVLPGVTFADLRLDVLQRARRLACSLDPHHAWLKQSEFEIMQAAGLLVTDSHAGVVGVSSATGVTVAGLLLLGTDAAIRRELPGRWVELRSQVVNADGFDEQDIFQTNLVDQYSRIMDFVARHLPEGVHSGTGCLRDEIFRALTANFLVHRDYQVQAWGRLVLLPDRVVFENPGRPIRHGLLDLASMQVNVTNPRIAGFFRELGLFSGTGQGTTLLARRGQEYFGTDILAFDRDIFKIFAPFPLEHGGATPAEASRPGLAEGLHARWAGSMQASSAASIRREEPLSLQFDEPAPSTVAASLKAAPSMPPPDSGRLQVQVALHRASLDGERARWVDSQARFSGNNGSHAEVSAASMQDRVGLHGVGVDGLHGAGSEPGKAEAHRERVARILAFCRTPRNREEIQTHIGLNNRDYFRKEILVPLLRQGLLVATIPDKPNSPKQQYRTP